MLNVIPYNGYTLKALPYHTSLTTTPDLILFTTCTMTIIVGVRHDTLQFTAIATSLPLHPPPQKKPIPFRPVVLARSIIRNHCSAPPLLHPPNPPVANGTNLYSLSVLMSPHAEKWPYHRPSGSHHLSPSPVGCQAQSADGQAEWGWGWEGGTHLSPLSCKLL